MFMAISRAPLIMLLAAFVCCNYLSVAEPAPPLNSFQRTVLMFRSDEHQQPQLRRIKDVSPARPSITKALATDAEQPAAETAPMDLGMPLTLQLNEAQRGDPVLVDMRPPVSNAIEVEPAERAATAITLSPEMVELRQQVRGCLAYYQNQLENAATRSPWGIMHAMLPFGVDAEIRANARPVNAIGWLCWNGACRGQRLLLVTKSGIGANQGPGVEGHSGQFLAMLAQSKVKRDFPLRISGRGFSVEDLIEHEKQSCRTGSELTFQLIGLSHYVDSDTTWKNDRNETWSVQRLLKEELRQQINGAACGGTHRLMSFSYAVNRRRKHEKEITGTWQQAQRRVTDYVDYTLSLQNRDGSFSTNWFAGRENRNDRDRKLQTTGHMLEWLVFSMPEERLVDKKMIRSVKFLTKLMTDDRRHKWEVGPRGHALRALVLFNRRVFNKHDEAESRAIAEPSPKAEAE